MNVFYWSYLHSTMDRFKYDIIFKKGGVFLIYIPLWIDLNPVHIWMCRGTVSFTFHYG